MKDVGRLSLLMDFYGKLLTDKQYDYLYDYYFCDLTFLEIGNKHAISKNAIYDSIKKAILELENYDSKLNLIESFKMRQKIYKELNLTQDKIQQLLETEVFSNGQKHK